MTSEIEKSHRYSELALSALKKTGLPSSPRNFELWYAHVEGGAAALSSAIQKAMDKDGKVAQDTADKLYNEYIQHAELSHDVMDLVARFHSEVSGLYDVVELAGENAHDYSQKLTDLSDRLSNTTPDMSVVGALLENMRSIAWSLHAESGALETRLAESASQISALQRDVEAIQDECAEDNSEKKQGAA